MFEAQLVVPWQVRRPRCTRSREIRSAPSLHRASTDALISGELHLVCMHACNKKGKKINNKGGMGYESLLIIRITMSTI